MPSFTWEIFGKWNKQTKYTTQNEIGICTSLIITVQLPFASIPANVHDFWTEVYIHDPILQSDQFLAVITKAALLFWDPGCCFRVLIMQPSAQLYLMTNQFRWHVVCKVIVGRMTIDLQKHYESA